MKTVTERVKKLAGTIKHTQLRIENLLTFGFFYFEI